MKLTILTAIALVIGVAGIVTVSLLYALTGGVTPLDYGVVIDAGSTHTEILLYKWLGDKYMGTGRVEQQDSCETSGGLATSIDPDAAAESLKPCLKNITSLIDDISNTSVFLGATAGFRLLNEINHNLSSAIIDKLNSTIAELGFNPEQVRIITGQEEGLYAWITSNFVTSKLASSVPTVGALDLGGASTQVAFETDANKSAFDLRLYGYDYHVLSQSSLCFGVEEIYRRHLAILVQGSNATTFEEPCAPSNYNFTRSRASILNQICTKTQQTMELWDGVEDKNITFNGTGNSSLCSAAVSDLLNSSKCSASYSPQHCFQNIQVPSDTQTFFAFSSFYYTTSFLNATKVTLREFQNATLELCEKTWEEVEVLPTQSEATLPRYCFQALYIEEMLTKKYSFNETTWERIDFVKTLNGSDIGWSLGYMVNATNTLPTEAPSSPSITLPAMIILQVLFVALIIVGFVFVWRMKRKDSNISYIQV